MTTRPDGKLAWITREHLNEILASYGPDIADSRARLEAAWDAAPADPAKAAAEALRESVGNRQYDAEAVLRALGVPDPAGDSDA